MVFQRIEQFAKPFTPSSEQLTIKEKMLAQTEFNYLVDDVLLAHMSELDIEGDESPHPSVSYSKNIVDYSPEGKDDLSHLYITVSDDRFGRSIQVNEMNKGQINRTSIYYSSSDSQEVLRDDQDPVLAAGLEGNAIIEALDTITSWNLEKMVGYSHQPIDDKEVWKLRQLLVDE